MRGLRCGLLASVLVLGAAAACGGGGGAASEPAATASTPAAQPEPSPATEAEAERKLRAAQESAVEALCERLVDCAIEEARASMTPEQVAELDVEDTGARLRDKCEGEGATSTLSPRQIRVVQRCVNLDATCDDLQACVAEAKKQTK
jgi:hypothetical protein